MGDLLSRGAGRRSARGVSRRREWHARGQPVTTASGNRRVPARPDPDNPAAVFGAVRHRSRHGGSMSRHDTRARVVARGVGTGRGIGTGRAAGTWARPGAACLHRIGLADSACVLRARACLRRRLYPKAAREAARRR